MPMGHTATAETGSGGLTATEHRLANGLRVVLSEDHLTPVAAVCLWYDVGSRHEVKGRTGLAHLFEHLMFQGSGQVKGNGHFELVQGAGGSLNGTTSFERTNYFETMLTTSWSSPSGWRRTGWARCSPRSTTSPWRTSGTSSRTSAGSATTTCPTAPPSKS